MLLAQCQRLKVAESLIVPVPTNSSEAVCCVEYLRSGAISKYPARIFYRRGNFGFWVARPAVEYEITTNDESIHSKSMCQGARDMKYIQFGSHDLRHSTAYITRHLGHLEPVDGGGAVFPFSISARQSSNTVPVIWCMTESEYMFNSATHRRSRSATRSLQSRRYCFAGRGVDPPSSRLDGCRKKFKLSGGA